MKNLLILGGAGFLGSNLVAHYLSQGARVYCLDDFSTGRRCNVENFTTQFGENFQLIDAKSEDISRQKIGDIEAIFNFATPAGPQLFQAKPATTISKLMLGAVATMEFAAKRKIPVLIASTSEVYGDPLVQPQDETYLGNVDPVGIRCAYNEGKRAEEAIAACYHREFGVEVKIARIFNSYGPYMDPFDGRMVSAFIMRALQNQPIEILGDGSQVRTLLYVDDLMIALERNIKLPYENWHPINIGSDQAYSVLEVAQKIISLTESNSEIIFKEARAGEPYLRTPDISKAHEILDWRPITSLENGLFNTIEYLKKYI